MTSPPDQAMPDELSRYLRQIRYAPLGRDGQRRLLRSRALVCGCGALGNVLSSLLVRAGVGALRIVDRDFVDAANLQRQLLFDEDDAAQCLPKAIAAAAKLRRMNSQVEIEPIVADIDHTNILEFCRGIDAIVDGADNFQTRFLINDAAVKQTIPWVYGGCLGAEGQTMTILPGKTACLRCLMDDCPAPGALPTCETAGILAPVVGLIASIQAIEAIKILSGNLDAVSPWLTVVDLWANRVRQVDVRTLREQVDCPTCKAGIFPWLSGARGSQAAVLCGRNAVQLAQPAASLSLDQLAQRLQGVGQITRNAYLLRLKVEGYELCVFPDGRAIISGTDDTATARALWAKYVGD